MNIDANLPIVFAVRRFLSARYLPPSNNIRVRPDWEWKNSHDDGGKHPRRDHPQIKLTALLGSAGAHSNNVPQHLGSKQGRFIAMSEVRKRADGSA